MQELRGGDVAIACIAFELATGNHNGLRFLLFVGDRKALAAVGEQQQVFVGRKINVVYRDVEVRHLQRLAHLSGRQLPYLVQTTAIRQEIQPFAIR